MTPSECTRCRDAWLCPRPLVCLLRVLWVREGRILWGWGQCWGHVVHCYNGVGKALGNPRRGREVALSRVTRISTRPIVDLIGAMETQSEPSELELDDVVITNPHIEAILENEDWIEDAS